MTFIFIGQNYTISFLFFYCFFKYTRKNLCLDNNNDNKRADVDALKVIKRWVEYRRIHNKTNNNNNYGSTHTKIHDVVDWDGWWTHKTRHCGGSGETTEQNRWILLLSSSSSPTIKIYFTLTHTYYTFNRYFNGFSLENLVYFIFTSKVSYWFRSLHYFPWA